MSFVGKMQPFLQPAMLPELAGLPCVLFGKHQGTQRRPSQAWILIFKAPLKKALLWGFGGFTPPKKNHDQRFFTWNVFFFLSLGGWRLRFLYICQGFGKVVDLGAELKSWCPRKKGYDTMVDPAKKNHGTAKRGVFWIFSSTLFFKDVFFFCAFLLEVLVDGLVGWFSWKSLDENFTTMGFLIPKESEKNHVALVNRALAFVL